MTVIRSYHKKRGYTDLQNSVLNNNKLSNGAIGLWAKCQSKPLDWKFYISELAKNGKDKRTAINSQIKELIDAGLCLRIRLRSTESNGKTLFKGIEYIFFPEPATEEEKKECLDELKKCFPQSGFLHAEFLNAENQQLQKNDNKKRFTNDSPKNDNVSVHNSTATPSELETPSSKATPYRPLKTKTSIVSTPTADQPKFNPATFDPKAYILPNREKLTLRCANAFAKYKGEDRIKLCANLEYFEKMCKEDPNKGEAYLQKCIKENYAAKELDKFRNMCYATMVIHDNNLTHIKVMKTIVKNTKTNEPISLSLPPDSFALALDSLMGIKR